MLAPRQAITLSVHFDPRPPAPTARASDPHQPRLGRAAGHRPAVTGAPRLAVSATHIDFGSVPVGQSKSVTFDVRDAGNVPLTITRAIAPVGEFTAAVPLPEGITIENGVRAAVTVTFRPTARGPASGTYLLNGNDGRGYVRVRFTGTGT